ncbi:hypothetical protein YC2023_068496 [Brassica napus]
MTPASSPARFDDADDRDLMTLTSDLCPAIKLGVAPNKITGELCDLWRTWRDVDAIRRTEEEDCRRYQDNLRRKHQRRGGSISVIPKDISYKELIRVVLEDFTIDNNIKFCYVSPSKSIFGTEDALPIEIQRSSLIVSSVIKLQDEVYSTQDLLIPQSSNILELNSHSKKTMNDAEHVCGDMHIKYLTFLR